MTRRRKIKKFKKKYVTDGSFVFLEPTFEKFNNLLSIDKRTLKRKKITAEIKDLIDLMKIESFLFLIFLFNFPSVINFG